MSKADRPKPHHWDAIVIGAGLGGLSAAAYLSACGKRTLLLERGSVLGGTSQTFRRLREWEFDCGVHFIGDCGPGGQTPTLLRGLALDDRIEFIPLDSDGYDTIVGPDLELRIPFGWKGFEERLVDAFPADERAIRRWATIMRRIGTALDRTQPFGPKQLAGLVAKTGLSAAWLLAPSATLMSACRLPPRLILTLSTQAAALSTTADRVAVAVHAGYIDNFCDKGSWYPRRGGQILAAGFAEVIRSHGGEIRTKAHVSRIRIDEGRVQGVALADGTELTAPAVVAAGDIKKTYNDLVGPEHLSRRQVRRTDRWTMATPLVCTYFGIDVDLTDTPNSNFYVIPNWDDADSGRAINRMTSRLLNSAGHRERRSWAEDFAANQPAFIQSSTRRDLGNTRSAPARHAAIEVQTIAPADPHLWGLHQSEIDSGNYRHSSAYREQKEILVAGLLDRVDTIYPGASSGLKWAEFGTPATQERYVHTSNGASFGLECRPLQTGPFRPGTRTEIPGLYLAGASTTFGPGTEGSMTSGLMAAAAITGRDLMREVRDGAVIADPALLRTWSADFDPLSACRRPDRVRASRAEDERDANSAAPLIEV